MIAVAMRWRICAPAHGNNCYEALAKLAQFTGGRKVESLTRMVSKLGRLTPRLTITWLSCRLGLTLTPLVTPGLRLVMSEKPLESPAP